MQTEARQIFDFYRGSHVAKIGLTVALALIFAVHLGQTLWQMLSPA